MTLIKSFKFGASIDGSDTSEQFDSRDDYGVIISGEGTFNAPEREVEAISIPGRNGQLLIDRGRFENIEVTYPAFMNGVTAQTFREKLAELRNALASKRGYRRLIDEYHPDEYRLACFHGGLEVEPSIYNRVGAMDITFDCKPQRYLLSGDEWMDILAAGEQSFINVKTVDVATNAVSSIEAMSVKMPIEVGRTGVTSPNNLGELSSYTGVTIDITDPTGGSYQYQASFPAEVRAGTFDPVTGTLEVTNASCTLTGAETVEKLTDVGDKEHVFKISGLSTGFLNAGAGSLGVTSNLFYTVYSKSSLTGGYRIYFQDASTMLVCIPDATTPERAKQILKYLYDITTPAILTARARTTQTYTVTPVINWTPSSADTISTFALTASGQQTDFATMYFDIMGPTTLTNPTPFESQPVIEAVGSGDIQFADVTITLSPDDTTETITIDCEVMEAWAEVDGEVESRNSVVSMSSSDFPKIPTGASTIYADATITSLKVKPRWWRV